MKDTVSSDIVYLCAASELKSHPIWCSESIWEAALNQGEIVINLFNIEWASYFIPFYSIPFYFISFWFWFLYLGLILL